MNPWLERLQRIWQDRPHAPVRATTLPLPNDVTAVKVWSTVLRACLWVVADDLPREAWPTDTPIYTYTEVKILRQVGREGLVLYITRSNCSSAVSYRSSRWDGSTEKKAMGHIQRRAAVVTRVSRIIHEDNGSTITYP